MDGVLSALAHDIDHDAATAIEPRDERVLIEAVVDGGDLAEGELGAIRTSEDDDACVIRAGVGAATGADGDVTCLGLHDTRGKVDGAGTDGGADAIEREAVFAQGGLRDLDADLIGPHARKSGVGDLRERSDFIAHLLAEASEIALSHVCAEDDADDAAHEVVVLDIRPLSERGEVWDGIDADFHVVDDLAGEIGVLHLDVHRAAAAGGGGKDALDAGDLRDGLLNAQNDHFLDFLRRGAGIGHGDG